MIIIGYQGIGKSTLAGKNNCIDLESGNFWVDGKRADDWYKPYCQIANHLSEQGYTVFTSSHEVVRNELKNSKEKVFIVFPATWLKDKWIKKLSDRYESTGLIKDFKAWKNAEERYTDNIMELMGSGFEFYNIKDIDYDLNSIVGILNEICQKEKGDKDD